MSSSILLVKRSIWGYFTRAFVITPCDLGQKLLVIEELRDTVSANLPIMSMAYASVQCFDKEGEEVTDRERIRKGEYLRDLGLHAYT